MSRARRQAAALLAALPWAATAALTACATPPREAPPALSGRLSLRVDATATQTAQSMTAAFELRGDARAGELRLFSALGTQLALARWAPGQATLATADGERAFADLDELAVGALGEPVPLAALPDWLTGRAWSAAPSAPSGEGFRQLGWDVDLRQHARGRIEARRSAPPLVVLRVQLDDAGG